MLCNPVTVFGGRVDMDESKSGGNQKGVRMSRGLCYRHRTYPRPRRTGAMTLSGETRTHAVRSG